jgi:site-specific recombinase XerD
MAKMRARRAPFTDAREGRLKSRVRFRLFDGKPLCHAHMLRHSAGFKLAGDAHDTRSIQDYLGHKDIRHTFRYTELSPTRFRDFWR